VKHLIRELKMTDFPEYMTNKHRHCDGIFSQAESAASAGNWPETDSQWQLFCQELELHLQAEETILFPKFEEATGMTSGPTQVMRMEHQQMRALISDINQSLAHKDKDEFLAGTETLMILMQQHNMKEEMMLYPMSAQQIPEAQRVNEQLQQFCDQA
jgi:iron-sulfur cluster repair protein YtfE (RIC family)